MSTIIEYDIDRCVLTQSEAGGMSGAIFALMQKYKKKKLLAIRDKVITNAPAPPAIKAKTVKARRKRTPTSGSSAKPGTNRKTRGAKIVKAAQKNNKKNHT